MLFLQLLVNGFQVGALYALIAVGFSLIFGSTKVFHFAHGATFTIAAYVFYEVFVIMGGHWLLGTLAASVAAVVFGVLLDRLVYEPIRRSNGSFFTLFVASFGVGIVVQNLIGIVFGRGFVSVPSSLASSIEVIPGLYASPLAGIAILCAIIAFALLQYLLVRTHAGIGMRALSENAELVRVYGLSPRRLSTLVFALGSLLVVPAAILSGATSGLSPSVGHHVMLISLAATIVGGVGSLRGAACAGLMLGMTENLALLYLGSQWSEAVTFIVLFIFILVRPAGFFGRHTAS